MRALGIMAVIWLTGCELVPTETTSVENKRALGHQSSDSQTRGKRTREDGEKSSDTEDKSLASAFAVEDEAELAEMIQDSAAPTEAVPDLTKEPQIPESKIAWDGATITGTLTLNLVPIE